MPGLLKDLPQRSELPNRDLTSNLPGPTYTQGADGLPTIAEKLVDPIIPAIPDNLICLDGCKHYCDCVLDSSDVGEGRELVRYCLKLSTAAELMELTDGSVFGCAFFKPPWWSIRGWVRWHKNRKYLKWARERIVERDMAATEALEDEEVVVYDE